MRSPTLVLLPIVVASLLTCPTVPARSAEPVTADDAGYRSMLVNGTPAEGRRPLLTLTADYTDQTLNRDTDRWAWRIYGAGTPASGEPARHVNGIFRENSGDLFSWRELPVPPPVRVSDDRRTTINEGLKVCADTPQTCPGVGLVSFKTTPGLNAPGHYVTAENGGGPSGSLNASREETGSWQSFTLIDRNGGTLRSGDLIELITYSGYWITAEGGGGGNLSVNRSHADRWEVFRITSSAGGEIRHGDPVRLQAPNGNYIAAEGDGGGGLSANRTRVTSWETFTFLEAPLDAHRLTRLALDAAAIAGVDLTALDNRPADGVLQTHELSLLMVNAGGGTSGQTSDFPCHRPPGAPLICTTVSAVNEGASLTTLAHELLHQLGAVDVYGSQCHNQGVTLMSCTVGDVDPVTYHLDPWHKIQLGWLHPRIQAIPGGGPGRCATFAAAQSDDSREHPPTVFYDPDRGAAEYLIVEHRSSALAGYDANVTGNGLAIWRIRIGTDGRPMIIPAGAAGVALSDRALLLFGAPSGVRGGNGLWTTNDGLISPTWLDASPTGLTLRTGPVRAEGNVDVEIGPRAGLRPRILAPAAPRSGPAGTVVELRGVLGAVPRLVTLTGEGGTYLADLTSWSCSGAAIRVPTDIPAGAYQVSVSAADVPGARSNAVTFVVTT
jgi:hypothetical protein